MYSVGLDVLNFSVYFKSVEEAYIFTIGLTNFIPSHIKYSEMEIKQVIFGSLLGDGKLEKSFTTLRVGFGFIQSLSQEPYFLMIWNLLSIYASSNYKLYEYLDERTGKKYSSLYFKTKSLPIFTEFWSMFYVNGVKVVPLDLTLFTPLAIAHLLMQDGSFGTSGGIYICTDAFSGDNGH